MRTPEYKITTNEDGIVITVISGKVIVCTNDRVTKREVSVSVDSQGYINVETGICDDDGIPVVKSQGRNFLSVAFEKQTPKSG